MLNILLDLVNISPYDCYDDDDGDDDDIVYVQLSTQTHRHSGALPWRIERLEYLLIRRYTTPGKEAYSF